MIVTYTDLKRVLKTVDPHMSTMEIDSVATHVINFFGYSESVDDNVLGAEDRSVFYMLEDYGILKTKRKEGPIKFYDREKGMLVDKERWRTHYWLFAVERIEQLLNNGHSRDMQTIPEGISYNELPPEAWNRSNGINPPKPSEPTQNS